MANEKVREEIPSIDFVYYRIHISWIRNGQVLPSAFRDIGDGMSVDWSRYSTPEESKNRAKIPEKNYIVKMQVGNIRSIKQIVLHDPTENNYSHSLVIGNKKDPETRLLLKRFSEIILR